MAGRTFGGSRRLPVSFGQAKTGLQAERSEFIDRAWTPATRDELHEALDDLSRRPEPDLTGAIQHAMAALECVASDTYGNPKATLGDIIKRYPDLPTNATRRRSRQSLGVRL